MPDRRAPNRAATQLVSSERVYRLDGEMKGTDSPNGYLQNPSRRRILGLSAGALATGTAGCTGNEITGSTETSSPAHEFNSPPYENVQTEEVGSGTTGAGEIVLDKGEYAQQEFEIEETAQLQIEALSEGGAMDLFLLKSQSDFEKYSEGKSAIFSDGFAETNIETIERGVDISPGSYFLIFDNTAVYGAKPQGTVRVEFQFVLETETQTTEEETEDEEIEEDSTPEGENNAEIVSESDMPKIQKVTDNFGHTFVWDPNEDDDVGFSGQVEDEVVVSEDTSITLTVEKILANPEDNISYTYDSSIRDLPNNMSSDDSTRNNTHSWDMSREDYSSYWSFVVFIRNGDDIYYQNEDVQSDFKFSLRYTNLTLEG